ncbi:glycerol ABC transporter substrate-binding protein [Halococcus salsus]|uniref:glycerol ABC transporter substrate-binding protein n=1 Tax=Halococcus salsus TaxID=2162894 RepID=UPI00135AFE38|nr:glycerol ABC transporter substrate-binding protein [Halococcus salsus]
MPDRTDARSRHVLVAAVGVNVVVLLYSILIANQLFVGFGLLGFLVFLYVLHLAYRLVRAHERIADALEMRRNEPMNER